MMKWLVLSLIAVSVSSTLSPAAMAQGGEWRREARKYGWLLDYRKAKQLAQEKNQPLMVVLRCIP